MCEDHRGIWTLQGITSWGIELYETHECVGLTVFTKVEAFQDWIKMTIADN